MYSFTINKVVSQIIINPSGMYEIRVFISQNHVHQSVKLQTLTVPNVNINLWPFHHLHTCTKHSVLKIWLQEGNVREDADIQLFAVLCASFACKLHNLSVIAVSHNFLCIKKVFHHFSLFFSKQSEMETEKK